MPSTVVRAWSRARVRDNNFTGYLSRRERGARGFGAAGS